jgi:hypothetical protein
MTNAQLSSLMAMLSSQTDADGWWRPPQDRFFNLYAANNGAALTVAKVEAVRCDDDLLRARSSKGEVYVLVVSDLFAVSVDAPSLGNRKAGFASGD